MSATKYLMDDPAEAERLEGKTDPARVRERLALLGVRPGMRVLDAGAGTGAIARLFAELVGPTGEVVAFDLSPERLAHGEQIARAAGLSQLRFQAGDLYAPPFPPDNFDLVWSEFVFEYLADPDAALRALVPLVRPGGKLVIADLDGNGIFHDPTPPAFAKGLETLARVLGQSFDPHAGRKLYHRFRRAGLGPVQVQAMPYHLYAGAAPEHEMRNWEQKFKTLRARVADAFGGLVAYDAFAAQYLAHLRDPDTLTYSVLFLVEWSRPLTRT
jgi:ubiquinone/menaquinone biosynthesis C-methylase UbiE